MNDLTPGDEVLIENHWGDFEVRKVVAVDKWRLTVTGGRFAKKSGWETLYYLTYEDIKTGKRDRHRVHMGDGKLFTPEKIAHFTRSQVEEAKRTELIYSALRLSPVLWRKLSIEQLETIHEWLTHTQG